ncbi:40S ribosomal protein mrp4 [Pyronema omphalodes]|nr:40S ribosomal protein mrp4 [Pyronema omphalodes]
MILRRAAVSAARQASPAAAIPRRTITQLHNEAHPNQPPSMKENLEFFKTFKKTTGQLGTRVAPHYRPHAVANNPPAPKDLTLELLLASGAHLGHATSLWNPGNQRYIYGTRQGIHIISLEATISHLRRAAKVVEGVTNNGGLVLFVGSRKGQARSVVEAAKLAGGCHLFEKWVPGTITNGKMIVGHGEVVEIDMADRKSPEGPREGDPLRPDLVVCLNMKENYVLLHECGLLGIPTIGVLDTDCNPEWVTYPIPANDDSLRCTQLIAGVLGRAGETGRLNRIRKAQAIDHFHSRQQLEEEEKMREAEQVRQAEKLKEEQLLRESAQQL